MFQYEYLPVQTLNRVTTEETRYYETPAGNFSSVTTIISKYFGDKGLKQWRDRVGHAEAERISVQASSQGTRLHNSLEHYLRTGECEKMMTSDRHLFNMARSFLDKNLETINGIEHLLYSKELRTAGTADLIGVWKGKYRAIADFKTAKKVTPMHEERLLKYRIQASVYAIMVEELYQIKIPYNIIIFVSPEESRPVVDITSVDKYKERVMEIFKNEKIRV